LTLVYIAVQLPLTVYILESFFARIPSDLFDAARIDGYSEWEIFWRVSLPVAIPAVATTVILNFILLWNDFLYAVVLITDEANRTLPLGIQRFMGDQMEDVGMIATGLMIAIVPVILVYAFFSEKLIQGMTAGALK
jgi:multiple sugar transport system permease protein/raffinose/stachyose/melibiose transport system permease protein